MIRIGASGNLEGCGRAGAVPGQDFFPGLFVSECYRFLEQGGGGPMHGAGTLTDGREKTEEKPDPSIRCLSCMEDITAENRKIAQNGRHQHLFGNPAGILYKIGCFSTAPGCRVEGAPSLEFTWFAGYSWQFAVCRGCNAHLGWYFQADTEEFFFGLIVPKLTPYY